MTGWFQDMDISILLWIQENLRSDMWTPFWKAITFLGNGGWFWIATSVLLLLPRQTRMTGVLSLLSLGLGAIITNLWLKPMVARPRPYETWTDMVLLISRPSDFSFPSGHTCAAFACALILLWMLPRGQGIPFVILAALIGFSRLYLGVHYPSDVLGGFLVGTFSSLTVYGWYRLVMHFMHGGLR